MVWSGIIINYGPKILMWIEDTWLEKNNSKSMLKISNINILVKLYILENWKWMFKIKQTNTLVSWNMDESGQLVHIFSATRSGGFNRIKNINEWFSRVAILEGDWFMSTTSGLAGAFAFLRERRFSLFEEELRSAASRCQVPAFLLLLLYPPLILLPLTV